MVETVKEIHTQSGLYKFLTWLALFIAVAALFVGWMAYNRSGEDLESRIQSQVEQSINQTEQAVPEDVDVER